MNRADHDTGSAAIERLPETARRDPLALRTDWGPLLPGGFNFRTQGLVDRGDGRLIIRPTLAGRIYPVFFLAIGIGLLAMGVFVLTRDPDELKDPRWLAAGIGFFFGSVFTLIGAMIFRQTCRPVVFDRALGLFFKGWRPPPPETVPSSRAVPLNRVHAVQIIREFTPGKHGVLSFEMNLVLNDASRVNVVDHNGLERTRRDAETVARLIGVPVWDATTLEPAHR